MGSLGGSVSFPFRLRETLVGGCPSHPGWAGRVSLGTVALRAVASPRPAAGFFLLQLLLQLANSFGF